MKIFIRSIQTLLLLSFFLPFIRTCTIREVKGKQSPDADSLAIDGYAMNDSLIHTPPMVTEMDSSYKTTSNLEIKESVLPNTKESSITFETILDEVWQTLTWPDYGDGLTGFGFSMFILTSLLTEGIKELKGIIICLIPLSFLCVIASLFIPIQKRKILLIISISGTLCLFILAAYLIFPDGLEDILFGMWLALGLFFIHTIYLIQNWNKLLQ